MRSSGLTFGECKIEVAVGVCGGGVVDAGFVVVFAARVVGVGVEVDVDVDVDVDVAGVDCSVVVCAVVICAASGVVVGVVVGDVTIVDR